jgi:hypothetical protein
LEASVAAHQRDLDLLRLELDKKADEQEQYSRRNSLRLFGVAEREKENLDAIVTGLCCNKLKTKVTMDDIDRCHRVGRASEGRPRAIIVKFVSYRKRAEVFRAKRSLRGSKITMREDLTSSRLKLLKIAIEKFGLKQVWTADGKVVVLAKDGKKHFIQTVSELEKVGS